MGSWRAGVEMEPASGDSLIGKGQESRADRLFHCFVAL